ncbi:MDR family MFS transporter [Bacillus fonticola]|uniref:MDR family MFS transporter n=1 Tax=Bacillus fonticola TaxID=2728853 RepID=UPI001474A0AC|nr:MDR family MFS transporter [Bacillus fonticola]
MEHLEQRQKIMIMLAIMSAMLFAALNQTIVGTALPTIIADLGGFDLYSWIFTIYMLTSSVTAVLVGKLSDIYGRKPFILIGIGVFTLGSFLSGLSETTIQLIIYRGIQGFGAGMIMSTAFTAVGDLFAPRERGRWQGIMGSVFGLASVFGPTLGGWIVDNTDWNWVFWIFLPFGLVAFGMIAKLFPAQEKREREPVDFQGSILLTLTIVPLLLAFTWGGQDYDWVSFPIIGLFVATIIALIFFIWTEGRTKSAVMPLELFKNDIFTLSNITGFILGMGMFGAIMYMPMFIQGVMGASASESGFIMMPMTLSMVAASTIGGQLITKTGKYRIFASIGLFVMGAGMVFISTLNADSTFWLVIAGIIILGAGLGLSMPVFTLAVQNAVDHKYLGVATASSQLFRQIGGTVGVAIMGSLMNLSITKNLEESGMSLPSDPALAGELGQFADPQALLNQDQIESVRASLSGEELVVFDQLIGSLIEALGSSISFVFLIGAIAIGVGFILTFFLREIPLRTSNEAAVGEGEKKSLTKTSAKSHPRPSQGS